MRLGNSYLAKLCLAHVALGRQTHESKVVKRYLNVLRNFAYLVTVGFWRSVFQLRHEGREAAKTGLNLHVFIMTGGIGDIIAAEPAVRAISRTSEHTVMLARGTYLRLFDFDPSVDAVIRVEAYLQALLLRRFFRNARWTNLHLDGYRCNMFRIAIANKNAAGISIHNYYDKRTLTDAYSLLATGSCLIDKPRVYPDATFDVQEFLKKALVRPNQPLLVVHTQATEPIRSWPAAHCREAINFLQTETEMNVLELGLDPVLAPSVRISQLRNTVMLSEQIAIMRHAVAFLGVDSGFSHIAISLGLPSALLVSKYKGFDAYLPWPVGPHDVVVRSPHLMRDIAPGQVVAAVLQLIQAQSKAP